MNPNTPYRRAHLPNRVAGEAVPLKPMPFSETRRKLNEFLKARGDVSGWPRRRKQLPAA